MEVFPLDEGATSDIGSSAVSQVEQMKSWDASFAQLEKMLQAACETDGPDVNNFSNELSPSLAPLTTTVIEPANPNSENKRKRNYSDSSDIDEDMKNKIFCGNKVLSSEITLKLIDSSKDSNDVSSTDSQLVSDVSKVESSIPSEANEYSQMEENDEPFQHHCVSDTSNGANESVFQCATNMNVVNKESEDFSGDQCLSLQDSSETFSFLDCKDTDNFLPDEDKRNVDGGTNVSISELPHDSSSNQRQSFSTNDSENDADNIEDIKNDNSSPVFSDNNEESSTLPVERKEHTDNCDMDVDIPGVSSTDRDKKDKREKDDHSEKNGKKDDKLSKKKKFERCNIRDIKLEDELDAVTLSAQKEEQERIKRLQEAQMRALQERLQIIEVEKEALSQLFSHPNADEPNIFNNTPENESAESSETDDKSKIPLIKSETDVILLESSDEDKKTKLQEIIPAPVESEENIIDISSSSSDGAGSESEEDSDKKDDDVLVLSDGESEAEPGPEDPNNSGAHTNDGFNLPDHEGRVLVNVGHPPEDPDIYLAPQIAKVIKPHQIGGIRFLYDNVVENLERYKSSSGFGCILAHSMGLGKTVQVVSFVDVFLRHTPATLVLCIVPINTIQNWKAEFDMWVPSTNSVENEQIDSGEIRPRDYNVYTLNENFKTMAARSSLIAEWRSDGGVLLMGYEMYRMLALRKMPKIPVKKGRRLKKQEPQTEPETTEQIKKFMDQMYEHIVIPGPDLVICDEGHRIKNSLASTSMALKSIKTRRRVVLTGYPLQNNLLEYWCMVDFVRPNYLGSRAEFCNMFERPISNGQCIDSTPRDRQLMRFRSHVLHSLLVGFVQRRGHSVLRAVLPKKEEHVLLIRMTDIQRKLYKCFVKDLLYVQQATNPLKLFAVCCKIWNHPDILYKLLQEKRAQEDIDLDIDLSAPGSSTSGTNALMKRKALSKDSLKCKTFQRPLKSHAMKIQGSELNLQKQDPMIMQGSPCQMSAQLVNIKKENQITDKSSPQQNTSQEHLSFTDLSTQICKEEYTPLHSSVGNQQQQSQNLGYSHSSMLSQNQPFTQSQYSQQQSSFCQSNYPQQSVMQPLHTSGKTSSPYPQSQYPSQQQPQQYLNNPVSQSQYSHSKTSFSSGSNAQQFSQQTANPPQVIGQHSQQQYNMQTQSSIDQNFATQGPNAEGFHQSLSQFPSQNNAQQYSQQSNLSSQQYPQQFIQQSSNKSQMPYNQESNNQQFNMQSSQTPQLPFNQQTQPNQSQYNQSTNLQQYSQTQQFAPSAPTSQYGQQQSQKYNEHSSGQHVPYSEKNSSQLPSYADQPSNDGQQCHDQSPVQSQSYPDHAALQQQFSQPASLQQQFCQSPAPQSQFTPRPQPSQQNRSQQSFPPATHLESKSFSQASPNSKLNIQSSPQQHFPQQPSPQFSQQASPLQPFSQCSPSQQSYSQQSPPLQQSPTQQYSLPSPTQQAYSQSFPQSSTNHKQFAQQPPHQYPQEASPQQPYPPGQYGHQSGAPQYPQHSSPQQQFSHQPSKQPYSQQFVQPNAQYPRQPSPQHFPQQSRQTQFTVGHQQQFSQQSLPQYKSHVTSQYSQQGNHSQFSPVSSSSQSQQFNSSTSQTGAPIAFSQQRQPYNSDQFPLPSSQSKSQQIYNQQTGQNVPSPQYSQSSKGQFSQSPQTSASPSFIQPSSPSSQAYSQQTPGGCHQGIQSKQYQHPFQQQSNQQNSQSAFPIQYQPQVQSCMQPPSQVPANSHTTNSKQLAGKGKSKSGMQQQTPEHIADSVQNTQYPQQTFQNNRLDQNLSQQQSTNPISNVSSFQPITSTMMKQENFVLENIKEDSDASYPARCPKAVLRPVKTQSNTTSALLPYQQGQLPQMQTQDRLKPENESVGGQDSVVVPIREKMDSSINYEWAIPIMKEYVLGVLENSHKMMVLFSIIEKTIKKGDKLLVFSQSLSTLDLLEHFLGKVALPEQTNLEGSPPEFWCRNKNYFRLDGSTSAQEREKLINEFNKNDNVSLFLLSTRAGCLGINLVGANRIVVMDASWNPCHDAQAVCRIYRYGQKKQCYIYRLVTDNSLEKRIYDRQVNKQGMSDRVVDELNPESNFTWKDVTTLIQDDEDDGPAQELTKFETSYTDDVLKYLVSTMGHSLSKEPFEHESLLLDRKDLKLTKQEKRLAKQSYEMAKRANMINIRTTYTYMPGGGQFIINNKQCQWVGGTTVRVVPGQAGRGAGNRTGTTATPITASPSLMNSLFKQGVMVQKLTIPSTISIPVLTPGAPPVVVPAGQDVLVLRTPKGVYLRLPDGRIIAVQLPPSLLAKTQFRPNVVTHFRPNVKGNNQTSGGRGQSIGIIKQTLQCGGTVRYLGPKNAPGNSCQNVTRNSAPEVIDLSDDDEPSAKKSAAVEGTSEVDSEGSEKDQSPNINNKSNVFQGKQITIRRVSPAMQQNSIQLPNTKEKCDLPLKLQQNQQITIMPINPSAQQSRQKLAPQLAQPVRVQQMLLQPQQGKRKPLSKNTTKIQLSSLSLNKSFQRQQITVTPTPPIHLQKSRVPTSAQSFHKSFEGIDSPKTVELQSVNTTKSCSSSPISITDSSKRLDINPQTPEHGLESQLENKEESDSLPVSISNQSPLPAIKAMDTSIPQVTISAAATLPGTMKTSFSSITEMNQQISNLMNQNLLSTSNSHSLLTQSGSDSQNSPVLPISVSQNLPPSVSVTPISQNIANPLPQTSKPCNLTSQVQIMSSNFLSLDSQPPNPQMHKTLLSSSQSIDQLTKSSASASQHSVETQLTALTQQMTHVSHSNQQLLDKNPQTQKSTVELGKFSDSSSVNVPKHSDSNSQTSAKSDIHDSSIQIPKSVISPYAIENSQNGQIQADISYLQQPMSHLHHPSGLQSTLSMPLTQSQQQTSSKKKKTSRQTSKKSPLLSQLTTQANQLTPQAPEAIHQFSHSSLSEHLHDHHRFQPFSHPLPNSDFQPFQSYSPHKSLLHIQHPQPLHPLQHSQEHSLASHLPHMPHLYPMAAHMTGNTPTLSDIQPQPPRAWPVPQSSISSFHPFGQSSQYYSSPHESSQFPFQPSSFSLSQPAATHVSQPEPSVPMTGLEHVSSSLSSEL